MKFKLNYKLINRFAILIIPILIIFWLSSSIIFLNRVSFSVLTYQTLNIASTDLNKVSLSKNNVYRGEFIAKDDNLGILIINIDNYNKQKDGTEDILIFKFKEKGKLVWDFKTEYSSNLFDSQKQFPFGIPAIPNSKNKTYQFELLSTRGDSNNPIKLKSPSVFVTGYQYSKAEIFGGFSTLRFIYNKIIGFVTDINLLTQSLIYLAPLILYLFLYIFFRRFPIKVKDISISFKSIYVKIFIILFLLKIISPKDFIPDWFILVLLIWLAAVRYFNFKSRISFLFSLILIIFWGAIIPFGFQKVQSILNELVYAFFMFGCLQLLYEQVKSIKK